MNHHDQLPVSGAFICTRTQMRQRLMNGQSCSEECREFVQERNSLLRRDPAAQPQWKRQGKRSLLAYVKNGLPLHRKCAHSNRCRLRGNRPAQLCSVCRARTIRKHLHTIVPFVRSTVSAISAVCIPCAAPLIITEASWL